MLIVEKYFRKTFRFSRKSTESYSCKLVPRPIKLVRDASLLRGELFDSRKSLLFRVTIINYINFVATVGFC